jgi:hypothetical protein
MGMIMKNLDGLQAWLGNEGLIFFCYVFCYVLSIQVFIMLSMCMSFDGMILLLLILSSRSLDETYVYVIATCHVHICCKRDFYFFFHCWYFVL